MDSNATRAPVLGLVRMPHKTEGKLLCVLLLSFIVVNAQTPESEYTEYLNWKKQVSTTLQDYNHLYAFQVAVGLKKTDKTHIHILLAVVGRTPNYYFILQPVSAFQLFDVDKELDKTGKSTEWGSGQDTTVPRLGYLLDFDKTIECDESTNAIFISIKPVPNTGQPSETTVLRTIVPLDEKGHFEKRDFFVPRGEPSSAPQSQSLDRRAGRVFFNLFG
jgi:hypothetical protein